MRRLFKVLAVVAATVAFTVAPSFANAQGSNIFGLQVQPMNAVPLSDVRTAADTDPLLYIKYVGTGDTAQVTVAATALTFTLNGAAYTGFECPVSGALGGIIDTSNAACDTAGEVVDTINNDPAHKFVAYIGAGFRSSTTNNTLIADSADNDVTSPGGEVVYWDSSTEDDTYLVLQPAGVTGGQDWFGKNPRGLNKNPRSGEDEVLLFAQEKITNAGTIGDFEARCVVENYVDGTETNTLMYSEAGGATTVLGKIDEFVNAGGLRCRDGKIVIDILASGADTSAFFAQAYGYRFKRVAQ